MSRGYIETPNILTGGALNNSGNTTYVREFPMGFGYYGLILRFGFTVTPGATPPTGPITDNALLWIKNVLFQSDRGENFLNWPGRAIARLMALDNGITPQIDSVGVGAGTYYATLHVPFVDWRMGRPEDTVVDTSRYNSCKLTVTGGSVADLWTTPNTGTVAVTLDINIESSYGPLPNEAKPHFRRELDFMTPIDASSGTLQVSCNRAPDLAIKKYLVHSCTGGAAGQPFSGADSDAILNVGQFQTQRGYIFQNKPMQMLARENLATYRLPAILTGLKVFDFVRDRSNASAFATGDKTYLNFLWTNQSGVSSGDLVTVAHDGIRALV